MTVFVALFALTSRPLQAEPILWLRPDGQITLGGRSVEPTFSPGTRRSRLRDGVAFDFGGKRSGLLLPDFPAFRLQDEITVSCWIYLRSYVNDGPGAQVLFRGDDRIGVDPYTLVIHGNGTACFGVQDVDQRGASVSTEVVLRRWTHLLGSFSRSTGRIDLYRDGVHVAFTTTSKSPFLDLDPGWAPGLGIGNVQNEKGVHNQPLDGMIFDLRLYDSVRTPNEVGPFPGLGVDPPN